MRYLLLLLAITACGCGGQRDVWREYADAVTIANGEQKILDDLMELHKDNIRRGEPDKESEAATLRQEKRVDKAFKHLREIEKRTPN